LRNGNRFSDSAKKFCSADARPKAASSPFLDNLVGRGTHLIRQAEQIVFADAVGQGVGDLT
jgi:hypothetical protein